MPTINALVVAGCFVSMAVAVPIRLPPPIGPIPYKVVLRQRPADSEPPRIAFTAKATDHGFVLHKIRGPETIEVLLGAQQVGDFTAEIDVDIAGFAELGIRPNGGTPVPYFGFRDHSGETACLFLFSTYSGGWHSLNVQLRREGGKVSARMNNFPVPGGSTECPQPGYLTFVMNDTSKIRIRRFDVRPAGPAPAFPLPK
jgi:hypothetical protein